MKIIYAEWILDLEKRLTATYWNMHFTLDSWFFCGDLAPHSTKIKYRCKRLYELGLVERRGNSSNRWGFQYKLRVMK